MVGTCRICSQAADKDVSEMDKDLLAGMDITSILYKYSGKFSDPAMPLTRTVLYTHKRHLRRSIPAAILQIPDMGSSKGMTEPTSLVRSEGFDTYIGTSEKDKEMVDVLVNSAMEDLISSEALLNLFQANPEDASTIMSVRNQLRKSIGEFIKLNKEMTSPVLSFNIGDTNKKLFIEFLLIVKKAAESSIADEESRANFLLEITSQLRKSKEFKSVLEEERDRREIMDNVEKESSS
jgi:hypothetical protein